MNPSVPLVSPGLEGLALLCDAYAAESLDSLRDTNYLAWVFLHPDPAHVRELALALVAEARAVYPQAESSWNTFDTLARITRTAAVYTAVLFFSFFWDISGSRLFPARYPVPIEATTDTRHAMSTMFIDFANGKPGYYRETVNLAFFVAHAVTYYIENT
jgi:hypothetical protein